MKKTISAVLAILALLLVFSSAVSACKAKFPVGVQLKGNVFKYIVIAAVIAECEILYID